MNHQRIKSAHADLEKYSKALAWLKEYGVQITGTERDDEISVGLSMNFASSCAGSKEALEVIAAHCRFNLPDIIKTSIVACENSIEMSKSAIREELDA